MKTRLTAFHTKPRKPLQSKKGFKRGKVPLSRQKSTTRRTATHSKLQKGDKSLAKWKKELDAVFSRYIRQRDNGQCFTCPKKDDPKRMQCGHFVPRQYLAVRWDEKNCNCQCYACNMLYNGQGPTYAIRLAEKYGQAIVEELERQRWVTVKLDPTWYEEKIAYYHNLLKKDPEGS